MTPESTIENKFVDYAKSKGCDAEKLRIDGENGFPDRTVITPVGTFFIEFKKPGGTLRPAQKKRIERLTKLNRKVFVCDNLNEAIQILNNFLTN